MQSVKYSFFLLQVLVGSLAFSHFQLIYTPEMLLEKGGQITLKMPFAHPAENAGTMAIEAPEDFYRITPKGKEALADKLQAIQWQSGKSSGKAFEATVVQRLMGDYIYVFVQAPYFETANDEYIQQFAKTIVNVGGLPTHWGQIQSLPIEIVPLQAPYKLYAGGTFSGKVVRMGKPVKNADIEVNLLNYVPDMKANRFQPLPLYRYPTKFHSTLSLKTDDQGVFTFGFPVPGIWGFVAIDGEATMTYKGKPLSREAVLWVQAKSLTQ